MYKRALVALAAVSAAAVGWWPAQGLAVVPAASETVPEAATDTGSGTDAEAENLVEAVVDRAATHAPAGAEELVWPIKGAVNTSFGGDHDGIDIEAETGDPIVAAAPGRVTFAGDDGDGYGSKLVIDHGNGVKTLYAHLAGFEVRSGRVVAGEVIGTAGCTGSCTGDHLHFEVHEEGRAVDPLGHLP